MGKKQRHVTENDDPKKVGEIWTWVAIDADSKFVPSFLVGKRKMTNPVCSMRDLASRTG